MIEMLNIFLFCVLVLFTITLFIERYFNDKDKLKVSSTNVEAFSDVFEDVAEGFDAQDRFYHYEEIVDDLKKQALERLVLLQPDLSKVSFDVEDTIVGDMRRLRVKAIAPSR